MDNGSQNRQQAMFAAGTFDSLDEVVSALMDCGLESSNLILGIDFTKSNEYTGRHSFKKKSLHTIGDIPNPYEQAISIIGRALSPFDEDNLIPCFGFGDGSTRDQYVFSFFSDHRPCHGFEEVLLRYREIVPHLKLSGPTSFAPLIRASMDIVQRSNGHHILVIIADGQVTRNPDLPPGSYSRQEHETINAITDASYFPLSIIMVGVGDGPWDAMQQFNTGIPQRNFNNFQFVNFTKIMSTNMELTRKEANFATAAFMEIPSQYRASQDLGPLENQRERVGEVRICPPPLEELEHANAAVSHPTGYNAQEEQVCIICLTNPKDLAFGCGHLACRECGAELSSCPICRATVTTRIRLFS